MTPNLVRWQVWKVITLRKCFVCTEDFLSELQYKKFIYGPPVEDMLSRMKFDACEADSKVALVLTTPRELGFERAVLYPELCASAQEQGLLLCDPRIAPELRIQYKDQHLGEVLYVGMTPIQCSDGEDRVFIIDARKHLSSYQTHLKTWPLSAKFVFVLPLYQSTD